MGFGSGGGGFTPSPNNVPGSTKTGTDKDTDVHEFTGSVDITGSLLINGVQITQNGGGGGGGSPGGANTQVQFNDNGSFGGSADLTFDGTRLITTQMTASTSIKAAALQVSSSVEGALFRVDHSTQAGSKPIIFVTGSGLVGIGTDAPRTDTVDTNRLHILGESGADQGQDPVDNTLLMLENNDHVGVQFMTPIDKSGFLVWGDADAARVAHFYFLHNDNRFHFDSAPYGTEAMTIRASGDSVNMGENNSAHMLTAKAALHISSSTGGTDVGGPVLLRVDHGDQPNSQPTLFVTGSGRVGVGTSTPSYGLHVSGSDSSGSVAAGVAFMGYSDDSTKAPGDATWAHIDHTRDNGTVGQMDFALQQKAAGSTIVNSPTGGNVSLRIGGYVGLQLDSNSNVGINTAPSARLHVNTIGSENDLFRLDGVSNNVMYVSGSGLVGIGTGTPVQTLSVSGSAAFSGAFGSTAIETLTANGTISANTGLTLIDASSSLAVNNTLSFTIANGTFAGQEKKIRGLIISGSDGTTSTGISIVGSNIDSPPTSPVGQINLSSSLGPGVGPVFQRAGCSLVWDGSKWLPVGNYNFDINNTGRTFI